MFTVTISPSKDQIEEGSSCKYYLTKKKVVTTTTYAALAVSRTRASLAKRPQS